MNLQELFCFARDVKLSSLLLVEYFLTIPEPFNEEIPSETLQWARAHKLPSEESLYGGMDNQLEPFSAALMEVAPTVSDESVVDNDTVLKNLADFWQEEVFYHMHSLIPSMKRLVACLSGSSLPRKKSSNYSEALITENELLIAEGKSFMEEIKKLKTRIKELEAEIEHSTHFQEIITTLQTQVENLTQQIQQNKIAHESRTLSQNTFYEEVLKSRRDERIHELEDNLNSVYRTVAVLKHSIQALTKQRLAQSSKGIKSTSNLLSHKRNSSQICQRPSVSVLECVKRALRSRGHVWYQKTASPFASLKMVEEELATQSKIITDLKEEQRKLTELLTEKKEENELLKTNLADSAGLTIELNSRATLVEELKKTVLHQEGVIASQAAALQKNYRIYGYNAESEIQKRTRSKNSKDAIPRRHSFSCMVKTVSKKINFDEEPINISLVSKHQCDIERLKHSHKKEINDLKYTHEKELIRLRDTYVRRLIQAQSVAVQEVSANKNSKNELCAAHNADSETSSKPIATGEIHDENNETKLQDICSSACYPNFLLKLPSATTSIHVPLTAFGPNETSITLHVTIPTQDFYVCTKTRSVKVVSNTPKEAAILYSSLVESRNDAQANVAKCSD